MYTNGKYDNSKLGNNATLGTNVQVNIFFIGCIPLSQTFVCKNIIISTTRWIHKAVYLLANLGHQIQELHLKSKEVILY